MVFQPGNTAWIRLAAPAADVIAVEMGDDDGGHFVGVDARRLHVLARNQTGLGRHLAAGAGIEQHQLALALDGGHGERNGHELVGQATRLEGRLDLIERGILYKVRIVRLLPEAVVHLNDFDVADLEFDDALVHQLRIGLLREGRGDKFERTVEAEHRTRSRRRDHESAP
jgi:hypothetical protein